MRKAARQEIILNLISARSVGSQQELSSILRKNGFTVTQASISRDLEELGVVKTNGSYGLPQKATTTGIFGIQSLVTAGDCMIVVKCLSGLASAAAVRIDSAKIEEIVGTIAGDDTIFIAVKDQRSQRTAMRKVWEIFEGSTLGQGA
jgi:transcriptional regulator of arginine metabolism